MKKILLLVPLLLLLSGASFASAQSAQEAPHEGTEPVVVATVNIYDAEIVSQQGNIFSLSFDLSNREGAQPAVRYAVQLIDQKQVVADEVVYPDVISLESHSDVIKRIEYTAPAYLAGTYRLALVSRNTNGLTLARASLGEVVLSGTGPYVEILPSTCFLQVEGEAGNKRYTLDQGVDIAPSETLDLVCSIKNHSPSTLVLQPSFETFYRSVFGASVQTSPQSLEPISVGAGTDTTFALPLPKAPVPQAYDVKLSFTNTADIPSNTITARYVLRGESATIQNLTLDKTSYVAGDTASISLFWTGPASNFFDARTTPEKVSGMQAAVSIGGSAGSCGEDRAVALDPQRPTQVIPFSITGACDSPKVSIRLVDDTGNVLASSVFDWEGKAPSEKAGGDSTLIYTVLAVAVLALLYGAWRMFAERTAGGATLILAGLCILSYGLPAAVHADTFTQNIYLVSSGGWAGSYTVYYDVNMNKSGFVPGETITASGNVTSAACGNSLQGAINATINGQNKEVFYSIFHNDYGIEIRTASNTFTAESTPGNYFARFYPELHVPTEGPGAGSYFIVSTGGDSCTGTKRLGFGGSPGGGCGTAVRDWVGQTPYQMPYTVAVIPCTSGANTCGQTNSGTIQPNGSCSATTPSNPAGYGSACTSSANACGQTLSGTIQCNGTCSATTPSNPAGYGNACTSSANSCGQTNTGTIQCNGQCSATTPANPAGYGSACTSAANACGQTNTGTRQCNGTCSATMPPDSTCAAPTCTINASPSSYNAPGSSTLSWTSTNATSFHISGVGYVTAPGSTTVSPSQSTTYNGTVSGPGGGGSCSRTLTVNRSCTFNGQTVTHGNSVTAYREANVPFGSSCQSQTRTCNDGNLTGTFAYSSCAVTAPANCTLDGVTVPHNTSRTFYSQQTAPSGTVCSSLTQSRTCQNGTLSGSDTYRYASCSCTPAYTCSGQTIRYTDASCQTSSVTTCVAPTFCSTGSSICEIPPAIQVIDPFEARPSLILEGDTTFLFWNLANANASTCSVTDSNGATVSQGAASSGADGVETGYIESQTVFTLRCTGEDGQPFTATATVNVIPLWVEI